MANFPSQRKPGQTGGWTGHFANRGKSVARGGSPSKGGGGGGKKPPGSGCPFAPELWVLILTPLVITTAVIGMTVQWLA